MLIKVFLILNGAKERGGGLGCRYLGRTAPFWAGLAGCRHGGPVVVLDIFDTHL